MEKLIEKKCFVQTNLEKIDRCNSFKTIQMSSKLDPVTFQVHFPATLTTDGTQWMQPNGWNLRKMTQQMYFFCFYSKKN